MKIQELSFLAVRLVSISLFILGLHHLVQFLEFALPNYLQLIKQDISILEVFLYAGTPAIFMMICAIVLWFLAEKISQYLIPGNSSESEGTLLTKELEGFALSVVGFVLIVFSFTDIVKLLLTYLHMIRNEINFNLQTYQYSVIRPGIHLLVGIILVWRAEGFALLLRKIRGVGLNHIGKDT